MKYEDELEIIANIGIDESIIMVNKYSHLLVK